MYPSYFIMGATGSWGAILSSQTCIFHVCIHHCGHVATCVVMVVIVHASNGLYASENAIETGT